MARFSLIVKACAAVMTGATSLTSVRLTVTVWAAEVFTTSLTVTVRLNEDTDSRLSAAVLFTVIIPVVAPMAKALLVLPPVIV